MLWVRESLSYIFTTIVDSVSRGIQSMLPKCLSNKAKSNEASCRFFHTPYAPRRERSRSVNDVSASEYAMFTNRKRLSGALNRLQLNDAATSKKKSNSFSHVDSTKEGYKQLCNSKLKKIVSETHMEEKLTCFDEALKV